MFRSECLAERGVESKVLQKLVLAMHLRSSRIYYLECIKLTIVEAKFQKC